MDEGLFWHTMNPARLHALYDAWFSTEKPQAAPEPPQQQEIKSLRAFFMGGE